MMGVTFSDKGENKGIDRQYLYFMMNDAGLRKVGISADPKKRAAAISNASGMKTTVVATWQVSNSFAAEQNIHRYFSHKRKSGEWFEDITQWDVNDYLNTEIERSEIQIEPIRFKAIRCSPRETFKIPCTGVEAQALIKIMCQDAKDYAHIREIQKKQDSFFTWSHHEKTRALLDEVREATGREIWSADFFVGNPVMIPVGGMAHGAVYFLGEMAAQRAKYLILAAVRDQIDDCLCVIRDRVRQLYVQDD